MATFTQDEQPYGGREVRRELVIDGIHYVVRLSDPPLGGRSGGHLERWELRRYDNYPHSGTFVDAFSYFPKGTKIEAAVERLAGPAS